MPIATLQFDLDNPDDRMAHLRCIHSTDMAIVLFELLNNQYKKICNSVTINNRDVYDGIDLTFRHINKLTEEHNIKIEQLIN